MKTGAVYDRTGWSDSTGTTCHKTLKAYVDALPEEEVKSLRQESNDLVNREDRQLQKIPHYINTGMYCSARLTFGRA